MAVQGAMWTSFVIPLYEVENFTTHCVVFRWHHDLSQAFILHGTDESFDYGNAAVLTDGAVPRLDVLATEPAFEVIGDKYLVSIANQILRFSTEKDRFSKIGRYLARSRVF